MGLPMRKRNRSLALEQETHPIREPRTLWSLEVVDTWRLEGYLLTVRRRVYSVKQMFDFITRKHEGGSRMAPSRRSAIRLAESPDDVMSRQTRRSSG